MKLPFRARTATDKTLHPPLPKKPLTLVAKVASRWLLPLASPPLHLTVSTCLTLCTAQNSPAACPVRLSPLRRLPLPVRRLSPSVRRSSHSARNIKTLSPQA